MSKLFVLFLALSAAPVVASAQGTVTTQRLFECTSDDDRIESLVLDKYITNYHGEDSIYFEITVTGVSSDPKFLMGKPKKYWIDNAPDEKYDNFIARFRDFKDVYEVTLLAPTPTQYLLTESSVKLNGEEIKVFCGYSFDPQCKDGSCRGPH